MQGVNVAHSRMSVLPDELITDTKDRSTHHERTTDTRKNMGLTQSTSQLHTRATGRNSADHSTLICHSRQNELT